VPPKLTAVVPVKFVPVITTVVPVLPEVGANDVIVGIVPTVKFEDEEVVPLGVVILMTPVVPLPMTAVI